MNELTKFIIIVVTSSLLAILFLTCIAACILWAITRRRTKSDYTKVSQIEKADLACNDATPDDSVKLIPSSDPIKSVLSPYSVKSVMSPYSVMSSADSVKPASSTDSVKSASSFDSAKSVSWSDPVKSDKSEKRNLTPTKGTANQVPVEEELCVRHVDLEVNSCTNENQSQSSVNSSPSISGISDKQNETPTIIIIAPTEISAEQDLQRLCVDNIDLTAVYCTKQNQLQVNVRQISLSNVEHFLNEDAFIYVVVSLLPDKTYYKSDLCPLAEEIVFGEASSVFEVVIDELSSKALQIDVFTSDMFSKQFLIRELTYRIAACDIDPDVSSEIPNLPITLSEIKRGDDNEVPEELMKEAEIKFSLSYMPMSGRLMFVAMKGRNVVDTQYDRTATYLRVSLLISGKAMKTVQTTGTRLSSSPVYNQSFIFHTPLLLIKDTDIAVTVMAVDDQENTHPRELGKVTVGPKSGSNRGRSHWQAMLSSPGQPVALWHVIGEFL